MTDQSPPIPIAICVAAGVAGALVLGAVVGSLLFGERARDPFVLAAVVLIATFGVAPSAIVTRQGLRLDPASVQRSLSRTDA